MGRTAHCSRRRAPIPSFEWCVGSDSESGAKVAKVNVLAWFARDELCSCPFCGEQAALPGEDGLPLICLGCGEPLGERRTREAAA